MVKQYLVAAALTTLSFGVLAEPVLSNSVTVDTSVEKLDSGDIWKVNSVSMGHRFTGSVPFRLSGSLEHEDRRLGSVKRAYLQTSFPVTKGATLELGVARGTGAVYSFRRQEHAMLYTSVGPVEIATGLYQSHYQESLTRRALLQARVYLPKGFTPILNLASGRSQGKFSGGSVGLGLEYETGSCFITVSASRGHEAEDPEIPYVTELTSYSQSAGLRCDLTKNVKLKLSTNATQAAILSRKGVSGALVISF